MALDVVITKRAEQNLDLIVSYLEENWTNKVKVNFLAQLSERLYLLSEMPYMYPASETKRQTLFNKQKYRAVLQD